MADKKDYYEVLGVDRNASEDAIKSEYRKKAKKFHPDLNPDDPAAEARFKELGEAYEVLSDQQKRARYDQFGHAGVDPSYGAGGGGFGGGFGGEMDLNDILESMLGGFGFGGSRRRSANPNAPRRGGDLRTKLVLSFMEAAHGCTKTIEVTVSESCVQCHGSGSAPGTSPKTCGQCHGTGHVTIQQSMLGAIYKTTQPCPTCGGKGRTIETPCGKCGGSGRTRTRRPIEVKVPAGIDNDQSLKLSGRGDAGLNGGPSGDIIVNIVIRPDQLFERQRNDIFIKLPLTYSQAALGTEILVPTIDGKVNLKIPAGTQSETVFRLDKKGIPFVNRSGRGNQFVSVQVEVPKKLSREQKQALQQLDAGLSPEKNYERQKSFNDKVKKAYK
jgi:chaperone protein DnaJ